MNDGRSRDNEGPAMTIGPDQVSSLIDSLPAVFQEDRVKGGPNFLGRFLLGFEQILLGLDPSDGPGLEEIIAGIHHYFDPAVAAGPDEDTTKDLLRWLAGWVALTLREDWDEARRRELIASAVQLYRWRGTRQGVEQFLKIYTRLGAQIVELPPPLQVAVHCTIGVDTIIDGGGPFFFQVEVRLPEPPRHREGAGIPPSLLKEKRAVAQAIVDLQKPAHTFYSLSVITPVLQVGVHSTAGVDTLLGQD
jgi:phage tail-like protein